MCICNDPMSIEELDCAAAIVGDDHIICEVEPLILDIRVAGNKKTA